VAAPSDNSLESSFYNSSRPTGRVIIDIGTGNGLFVYQSARQNPDKFYIGIDANVQPLKKISERIYRKPSKGGADNVLFIQSAAEDLPRELDGVASEVHIHFPWGSLLKALATGDPHILSHIRKLCEVNASLEVVIGLDPKRDATEIARLGLEFPTLSFIDADLTSRYRALGFEIKERGLISSEDWPALKSSWAKRLQGQSTRPLIYWIATAL